MAITVTTNTLSTNARYVVYSASTVNEDAETLLKAITDAIIDLGWERYDNAGTGNVLGSASAASRILRKATYDNNVSGHYLYMGITLTGTSNTTYSLAIRYGADYTSNSNVTSVVSHTQNGHSPYDQSSGQIYNPSFSQGGTIWLFGESNSLVMYFTGIGFTAGGQKTASYFGQYKKSFGENCSADTGYIHNGLLIDGNTFWRSGGHHGSNRIMNPNYSNSSTSTQTGATVFDYRGVRSFAAGTNTVHFALTEYPTTTSPTTGTQEYFGGIYNPSAGQYSTPASGASGFAHRWATRAHMGWLGWVGHVSSIHSISLEYLFNASFVSGSIPTNTFGLNPANRASAGLGRIYAQYLPNVSQPSIALYEPTLSCGTFNSPNDNGQTSSSTNFTSPSLVFAMLGKPYGFRVTIGQPELASGGYQFLDTAVIPLDAEGFFDESGTNTECWCVPIATGSGHSACIWVKK